MDLADTANALPPKTAQWPNAAARSPDDMLSHDKRAVDSTTSILPDVAPASLALKDRRALHGADRDHYTSRQQRAGAMGAAGQDAYKRLNMEPPIHNTRSCTASFSCARGRARVRFSRAAGREHPIARLRCEFELGLSLKIKSTAVT